MPKKRKLKKGEAPDGQLDEKSKKFFYLIGGIFVLLVLLFIGLEIANA